MQSAFFIPVTGNPKSPPAAPPGVAFPQGLFDFVLLNLGGPRGNDGPAAFLALRKIDPAVRCAFMRAFAPEDKVKDVMRRGAVGFLQKPLGLDKHGVFAKAVRELSLR